MMGMFGFAYVAFLMMVGGLAGGPQVELTAPRDTASEALEYVLEDADFAFYGNLELAYKRANLLIDEFVSLPLFSTREDTRKMVDSAVAQFRGAIEGLERELGLQAGGSVGTVVGSLRLDLKAEQSQFLLRARIRPGDKEAVLKLVKKETRKEVKLKKQTLFLFDEPSPPQKATKKGEPVAPPKVIVAAAWLEEGVLYFGDLESVKAALGQKSQVKFGGNVRTVMSGRIGADTELFFYARPRPQLTEDLRSDPDTVRLADFLDDVERCTYVGAQGSGEAVCSFRSIQAAKVVYHLAEVETIVMNSMQSGVDALYHLVLGVMPLLSEREIGPEVMAIFGNEENMNSLRQWMSDRLVGKASVEFNAEALQVTARVSNPAGVMALLALAGAGAFFF